MIPHRAVFKAQEVCELAEVQPYVLRSWEAEFPDLGVSKTPDGPRLYRRADVELVLRIRDLLLVDGLTLAGARRQLLEEGVTTATVEEQAETITDADVVALVDKQTRKGLTDVREGLGWILGVLNGDTSRRTRAAKPVKSGKAKAGARSPKGHAAKSSGKRASKSTARKATKKKPAGKKRR
ncbi:MAG TPA: MerR family transcriptional regulator [Vicinamibacterales bacterium]|nr:MerR family transcriptional regulator [Vicinamibacterales bacterium]